MADDDEHGDHYENSRPYSPVYTRDFEVQTATQPGDRGQKIHFREGYGITLPPIEDTAQEGDHVTFYYDKPGRYYPTHFAINRNGYQGPIVPWPPG